jgi:hypothetical protein
MTYIAHSHHKVKSRHRYNDCSEGNAIHANPGAFCMYGSARSDYFLQLDANKTNTSKPHGIVSTNIDPAAFEVERSHARRVTRGVYSARFR